MTLFRIFLTGLLGAVLGAALGTAQAQTLSNPNPGIVVEIYVFPDGSAEITCPTSACQATCRDVEGQSLLVQGEFYRIGSNCTVALSNGEALQQAVEELIALLGDEVPAGDGTLTGTTTAFDPNAFDNTEADPAQNTEDTSDTSPSSATAQ